MAIIIIHIKEHEFELDCIQGLQLHPQSFNESEMLQHVLFITFTS